MSEKRKIFELQLVRKAEGTSIKIKSQEIEKMFKEWSRETKVPIIDIDKGAKLLNQNVNLDSDSAKAVYASLQGKEAWKISAIPSLPSGKSRWGFFHQDIASQGFNLRFLTIVGLSEGVEIVVATPMSLSMLENFSKTAKEAVWEFYREYAKPVEVSVTLTEDDIRNPR